MHTVDLIANALRANGDIDPPSAKMGTCCLTGSECMTVPRELAIKSTFTQLNLLKAPASDRVGVNAYHALNYKWERMSLWFVSDKGMQLIKDKATLRLIVMRHAYPDRWAGYVTTSYKKHGALVAPVSTREHRVWALDELQVDLSNHSRVVETYNRLIDAKIAGIGNSVMESLEPPPVLFRGVNPKTWLAFRRWALPRYQSPLYRFCLYLLPSMEDMKKEAEEECRMQAKYAWPITS